MFITWVLLLLPVLTFTGDWELLYSVSCVFNYLKQQINEDAEEEVKLT